MELFKHQKDIISADPKKCGLFLGTGSGKTLIALSLAQGKTLVICPKTQRDDKNWQRQLEKMDKQLDLTVLSKEEFKRDVLSLPRYDTVIIDESHTVSGVSPTTCQKRKLVKPKTSQIFDACITFIESFPPDRLYLCTATPTRNAMSVYALAQLLGRDWDFYQFRSAFYMPVKMGMREIWMMKKDTQERLGKAVRGLGYTGQLSDWLDVPEQTHKVINVPLTKEQIAKIKELPIEYPDPLVLLGKKHQVEQGVLKGDEFTKSETFTTGKIEVIEDLYEEFCKVLVFCKYTEQIDEIKRILKSKGVVVYTLTGATKDRGTVISEANSAPRCVVIAQSSVSAGYELPSFRCTIFASMSYSYVDLNQSWGRTLRINNLQKNLYVYLLSGEIDKAVYKSVAINKEDFQESIYEKE